jgi:hypothetical protein
MRYFSLLFLILPWALLSQQPQASISKKVAEVGDRVDLVYRIELNQKDKFNFNPHSGIFPAKLTSENSSLTTSNFNEIEITLFEDSMINKGDKKIWMGVYELTPWDSGLVVLQGQRFTINDSTYDFPSVYLECKLVPHKKGQEIYDIKESFAKTPERKSWLIFFLKYLAWWLLPLIGYLIYRLVISGKNKPIQRPQMEMLALGDQSLQQLLITFTPILLKRVLNIKIKMRDSIQTAELILKPFTRMQEVGSL